MAPEHTEHSHSEAQEEAQATRGLQSITQALSLPLQDDELATLRAGEWVQISGTLHLIGGGAARALQQEWTGQAASFIEDEGSIFLADTNEAPLGKVMGSMEPLTTGPLSMLCCALVDAGTRCLIGSGPINEDVRDRLKKRRGVYLTAMQGTGALLARAVHQAEVVAGEALEQGAIRRIKVARMPFMVALDGFGRYLFPSRE